MSEEAMKPIPRSILIAAGAMVAFTICASAVARWNGLGASREPTTVPASQVRELRFEDRNDGAVAIYQAKDGALVDVLEPGTSGFVRIVMRSLARERRLNDQGPQTPFKLIRWADGRLSVEDPTTGRHIDLGAFGAVNTQAFARLMTAGVSVQ